MSAQLLIEAETLTTGSAQGETRLARHPGRSVAVQIDTDGTLVLGSITFEARNTHPDAVNSGGEWIDVTSELDDGASGDDLTAGQGARGYNFTFLGYEEIRLTCAHGSGSGDISATIHAVP